MYTQVKYDDLSPDIQRKIDNALSEHRPYRKTVYVYDFKTHETIGVFNSIAQAANATRTNRRAISSMLNGNIGCKSRNGYIFSLTPILCFDHYTRKTNAKKQDVYIYKNGIFLKKVESVPEASRITGINRGKITSRYSNGSLNSIDGYCFTNHKLNDGEIKKISGDKYSNMKKQVNQYSLDGVYIRSYKSGMDACRNVGGKAKSALYAACKDFNKTAYGYRWTQGDDVKPFIKVEKKPPIIMIIETGEKFTSIKDCANAIGCKNHSNIIRAAKNNLTAKGYHFKRLD